MQLSPDTPALMPLKAACKVEFSTGGAHKKRAASCANSKTALTKKPSTKETGAMASKPDTRIPSEPQRYERAVPIVEAARNVLADLAKRVAK